MELVMFICVFSMPDLRSTENHYIPSWNPEVFCISFSDLISIGDSLQSFGLPRSCFILSLGHQCYHTFNDCPHPVLQWQESPSSVAFKCFFTCQI